MKEFINELKHNQDINYKKGLENRINIDYIIERLEELEKSYNKYFKERLDFLNGAINHFIEDRNNGKLDAAYARRTGLLEILWGLISILSGILVLAVRNPVFTWIALAIVVIGTAISLILNTLFSIKKK